MLRTKIKNIEQNEPTFNTTVISGNNIVNEAQINKHRETKVSFHFHLDSILLVHHVLLYPSVNHGNIVTRYDNYTNTLIMISIETSNKTDTIFCQS